MQKKTIRTYLDCGCAILDDGSITRCPTCTAGIEEAEGRQYIDEDKRMDRADHYRAWQETTNDSQAFYKAIDGLKKSVANYIETSLEQFEDAETSSVPQTSYRALSEHLSSNLVNVIASTVKKKERR